MNPNHEEEGSIKLRPEQERYLKTVNAYLSVPSLPTSQLSRSAVSSKSIDTRRSVYGKQTESQSAQKARQPKAKQ